MMLLVLTLAAQIFSVTIWYGPPILLTIYVDRMASDAASIEELVKPSLCKAVNDTPKIELPVAYEVIEQLPTAAGGMVPGRTLLRATLTECPSRLETPA